MLETKIITMLWLWIKVVKSRYISKDAPPNIAYCRSLFSLPAFHLHLWSIYSQETISKCSDSLTLCSPRVHVYVLVEKGQTFIFYNRVLSTHKSSRWSTIDFLFVRNQNFVFVYLMPFLFMTFAFSKLYLFALPMTQMFCVAVILFFK